MVGGSIKSYLLKRVSTVRIRPGAPEEYRARYRYGAGLFWSKGRIRTVDTRVANFPAGGVFESARGHQRNIEPGTATAPGSSGLKAGFGPSTPASPISPRGGSFRIRPEHQRNIEPGTTTVPGSFCVRAAPFHASGSHQKQSARLPGEQAGASERICLRRSLRR